MPKAKKFDKKKGVTFQLVHRSQQDPLVADENAPQRILVPVENKNAKKNRDEILAEQQKYGIFFDDDSNYLQHLKDVQDNKLEWPEHVDKEIAQRQAKLKLPSTVFASEVEEEVGMLNKAAPVSGPQLHLDSDIVAAMDEDFDYSDPENQLEDNFMQLANGPASEEETEDGESIEMCSVSSCDQEETKSRLTNRSVTSAVIRRTELQQLLDKRFDKMIESYDDSQIGALDSEDVDGYIPANSDILLKYAEEFERSRQREQLDKDVEANEITKRMARVLATEKEKFVDAPVVRKPKYDCKTILSTYSNKYNRPREIPVPPKTKKTPKIVVDKKTGIPKNVLDAHKLTAAALSELDGRFEGPKGEGTSSDGGLSQLSTLSIRPKDENPAERRERKRRLKEYRRERRKEKKLNREAFVEEAKRQMKNAINKQNNVQGNKIL